jgi:hypothetical protein
LIATAGISVVLKLGYIAPLTALAVEVGQAIAAAFAAAVSVVSCHVPRSAGYPQRCGEQTAW